MARLSDRRQEYLLASRFRLTPQEVAVGVKLRTFARDRLGIELHVGQIAFGALVLARDDAHLFSAKFLTLMLASGNRAGKTSLLAVIIIFCCLDKTNRPKPTTPEEAERWLRSEYHWYHFGIAQEVADLVFNDIVRLLSGHARGAGGQGLPAHAGWPVADWGSKEYGDYRWIRFAGEWGGAEVHFRTTGEKALGSLGKDMHGVSFDEAGIERNLPFLIKEVFNLRRIGTGGQLLMVSTPSEDLGSDFADNWELGNPLNPKRLTSWRSLRMSSRDNVGYGLAQVMFDRLIADMDERTIRQNIDGEFLQAAAAYFNGGNVEDCFVAEMPERSPARLNGIYLQGLDPAKSADSAWSIVLAAVPNSDPEDIDQALPRGRPSGAEARAEVHGVVAVPRGRLLQRVWRTPARGRLLHCARRHRVRRQDVPRGHRVGRSQPDQRGVRRDHPEEADAPRRPTDHH
jgi:hypothetical protein